MADVAAWGLMAAFALALLAAPVLADRVTLIDGRVLEGSASEEADQVRVQTSSGIVTFPRSQVASVEKMSAAESQLQERLSKLPPDDTAGLFALAQWADEQGLDAQAEQLYRQVLRRDDNHAGARRALKNVLVDGRWEEPEVALQILSGQIDSGLTDPPVEAALTQLAGMQLPPEQQAAVRELLAQLQLRRGNFAAALAAYQALQATATPAQLPRIKAICQILSDHDNGMYVLTETYPPGADLLGSAKKLPPGPASLSNPLALEAALRDQARSCIDAAARDLEDARASEPSDAEAARKLYLRAMERLDQADALVPNIARSYKVELTRRQIDQLRQRCDAQAAQFDSELELLGRQSLSPEAYGQKVGRMIRLLSTIRADLEVMLKLAKPYDRDLIVEIQWAQGDRDKVDGMLATLKQEMYEGR